MSNTSAQILSNTSEVTAKGFIKQLIDGDFGLAKTYWLYFVLGGMAINLLLFFPISSSSLGLIVVSMLAAIAYDIVVLTGIWNSASRYTGSKIWSVLAKIIVGANAIFLVFAVILMFSE